MSIRVFPVTPTGVGRRDYSQNVEQAVEPIIRSHLTRIIWTNRYLLPTLEWGVDFYAAPLAFEDLEGNVTDYVPQDPKYTIYSVQLTGSSDTLTECRLIKYTRNLVLVEDICRSFEYGGAKANFEKGYVCEPGYMYFVVVNQWTDKPFFEAAFVVTGVMDILPEVFRA